MIDRYHTNGRDMTWPDHPSSHGYWDDYDGYAEPPPATRSDQAAMATLMGMLLGCAAGAVLAAIPWMKLSHRREDLIGLGAALGGLAGICRELSGGKDD